jgi:signal transduction histidine kinase
VTVRTPDSGLVALEQRYEALNRVLPYVFLVIPLIPYALTQSPSAGAFGITLGLAVLAAAWITWMTILHPRWERRPWRMWVYIAGLDALILVLTVRSPWFAFFSWIGFVQAFRYLSGAWRWVASVPVAVAIGMAQSGGFHRPTVAWVVIVVVAACIDMGLMGGFGMLGVRSEEQNRARKKMIVELAEANASLHDMMAENTGLQAQLLTQAREAGVLEERQRMAREIHDTLAQGLAGIITQLEAADQGGDHAETERRIGNAKRLARDSLTEARRSVQALRPEPLEDSRLPDALAKVAERWSATSGVTAEVVTTGAARALHPEVEATLLRVTQEALSNVAKHASAARVWVTLSYMEDVVTLDVRDDGTGFEPSHDVTATGQAAPAADGCAATGPAAVTSGGFGLTVMRQRVGRLAGSLEIESEPGSGTVISASLPAIPLAPAGYPGEADHPAEADYLAEAGYLGEEGT